MYNSTRGAILPEGRMPVTNQKYCYAIYNPLAPNAVGQYQPRPAPNQQYINSYTQNQGQEAQQPVQQQQVQQAQQPQAQEIQQYANQQAAYANHPHQMTQQRYSPHVHQQPHVQQAGQYAGNLQHPHRQLQHHQHNQQVARPAAFQDEASAAQYAHQQQQQQQQQLYNQQQQQLLRQLYTQHPYSQGASTQLQAQHNNQILTAEEYANYLSKQNLQAVNSPNNAIQQHYHNVQYVPAPHPTNTMAYTSQTGASTTVAPRNGLGLEYSPANKASRVKYTSGNSAYNY